MLWGDRRQASTSGKEIVIYILWYAVLYTICMWLHAGEYESPCWLLTVADWHLHNYEYYNKWMFYQPPVKQCRPSFVYTCSIACRLLIIITIQLEHLMPDGVRIFRIMTECQNSNWQTTEQGQCFLERRSVNKTMLFFKVGNILKIQPMHLFFI